MNVNDFCAEATTILVFIGWVLTFFKISIPLLIIGFGIFDLGKAVVASKDEEIKSATKKLMRRAIAGIIIFFIPSIVMWLFATIQDFTDAAKATDFEVCKTCILEPWDC